MKIDILVKFCTLFSFLLRFQWVVNGSGGQNPLRAQSKYDLMGSSAKTGKKIFEGHRSSFWIKMPFGIGHPPPTHQLQSTCVGEGSRVPNLQTEFNYLDSFKSYGIFSDFIVPVVPTL